MGLQPRRLQKDQSFEIPALTGICKRKSFQRYEVWARFLARRKGLCYTRSMPKNVMLHEAIEAIRQGQRRRARDLLTRLLRSDQSNPQYWLWMSSVVDTLKERVYCLQMVLRLDPENRAAQQGLVLLGAMPPEPGRPPTAQIRRKWEVATEEEPQLHGLQAVLANPGLRALSFAALALVVLGLILGGVFGFGISRKLPVALQPTETPGPPPTFTATPTFVNQPKIATAVPTATSSGPQPLWTLLEATYTPTPLYVATPHAISEAYRTAQRAYLRGDWKTALEFMKQAGKVDPEAADIQFYVAEIERFLGNHKAALAIYEQAIAIDPNFAPAYLGRARSQLALNPHSDVSADLKIAIEKDPHFGESYLERAATLIKNGEVAAARKDLKAAEKLLPDSPILALSLAQAALLEEKNSEALAAAKRAIRLDLTLLPAYLVLGQASLLNGEISQAIQALQTYVKYAPEDAAGWTALGRAYYETGKRYELALEALEQALQIDDQRFEIHLYRGLVHLALRDGQQAVNALVAARRMEPNAFAVNLGLGRALLSTGREKEAYNQYNYCQKLAQTDEELAAVYYWRAQLFETTGDKKAAVRDWQALLKLPQGSVPTEWAADAKQQLTPTATSTATPATSTAVTKTPSASRTPTAAPATRTPVVKTALPASPTPTRSR